MALGSGKWRYEPSLYFAMSFLIDSSIMITSQVSHRVPPQDSSASLSRVVSSGPQRCGLARSLGLLARGQCLPHPCPELGEGVGFAASGSLPPSCQEASCGGPRPPPSLHSSSPHPTPRFSVHFWERSGGLSSQSGCREKGAAPKARRSSGLRR